MLRGLACTAACAQRETPPLPPPSATTHSPPPPQVTKYIKTVTKVTRVSKSARERRVRGAARCRPPAHPRAPPRAAHAQSWPRFGAAAASRDDSNVTIKVHDPVPLEIPGKVTQDADMQAKIMKTLKKGQEQNAFKKQFQKLMGTGDEDEEAGGAGGAAGGYSDLARAAIGDMHAKLGMRSGPGVSMEDDQCAIRISNLSKDATSDDVRELVAPFGRVARCTVPKNRLMESRGFAYVNFYTKQDAQKCIEGLDGYGYDYLILEVRMAEARRQDPGAGGMRHVTGYGKQLPQNLG